MTDPWIPKKWSVSGFEYQCKVPLLRITTTLHGWSGMVNMLRKDRVMAWRLT